MQAAEREACDERERLAEVQQELIASKAASLDLSQKLHSQQASLDALSQKVKKAWPACCPLKEYFALQGVAADTH